MKLVETGQNMSCFFFSLLWMCLHVTDTGVWPKACDAAWCILTPFLLQMSLTPLIPPSSTLSHFVWFLVFLRGIPVLLDGQVSLSSGGQTSSFFVFQCSQHHGAGSQPQTNRGYGSPWWDRHLRDCYCSALKQWWAYQVTDGCWSWSGKQSWQNMSDNIKLHWSRSSPDLREKPGDCYENLV